VFAIPGGERLGIARFEEYTADSNYLFHANPFPRAGALVISLGLGNLSLLFSGGNKPPKFQVILVLRPFFSSTKLQLSMKFFVERRFFGRLFIAIGPNYQSEALR
jgi:hypothetical protein